MKTGIRHSITKGTLEQNGRKEKNHHKMRPKEEIKQCTTCPYSDCRGGKNCKRLRKTENG